MELDKAIKSRKSVRKFSSKEPDWKKIVECVDSMRYSPIAGRNCVLKIILVDNSELIWKIADACQQDFIKTSKYVVLVCSNVSRLVNVYEEKGEIYSRQQAGASIQNFLLKLEEVGLSSCWVGYFVDEQIKKALKIPYNINIEAVFPVGFDAEKKRTRKAKIELRNIVYFNSYGDKKPKPEKKMGA